METLYESLLKYENENLTALYYENKTISFKEFFINIRKLVTYLNNCGIHKGDVVTTVLPNIPLTIYLFYALNAIGAIQNIIYPLTPLEQVFASMKRTSSHHCVLLATNYQNNEHMFNHSEINFYFVNPMYDNSFIMRHLFYLKFKKPRIQKNIRLIDAYHKCEQCNDISTHDSSKDSIYLHSGGTTSTPKVIALSDDSINNLAKKVPGIINHDIKGQSMLAVLPTFHGFGLGMGIHSPLFNGASSALMMKFNAKKVIKWINEGKIDLIIGVPELYRKLLNNPKFINSKLENLEFCFVGGDNVHQSLLDSFNKVMEEHHSKAKLLEGYGLTETVTVCAVNTKENCKPGSVGKPLTGIKALVLDEDMKPLLPNQVGELFITGNTIMNKYLNDESTTKKTLVNIDGETYVKTGDLGYIDDDGYIFLKGRKKRMFIISGFNVYPGEVEKIVTEIEGIHNASLECFENPKIHLNLYVIKSHGCKQSDNELRNIINNTLKSKVLKYSLPSKIIFLDEFPKTKVGKIDHKLFKDID